MLRLEIVTVSAVVTVRRGMLRCVVCMWLIVIILCTVLLVISEALTLIRFLALCVTVLTLCVTVWAAVRLGLQILVIRGVSIGGFGGILVIPRSVLQCVVTLVRCGCIVAVTVRSPCECLDPLMRPIRRLLMPVFRWRQHRCISLPKPIGVDAFVQFRRSVILGLCVSLADSLISSVPACLSGAFLGRLMIIRNLDPPLKGSTPRIMSRIIVRLVDRMIRFSTLLNSVS